MIKIGHVENKKTSKLTVKDLETGDVFCFKTHPKIFCLMTDEGSYVNLNEGTLFQAELAADFEVVMYEATLQLKEV